jgi:hypothetical protein
MNLLSVYSVEKQDCLADEFKTKGESSSKEKYNTHYQTRNYISLIQDAKISTETNYLQNGMKYWTSGTDQFCPGRFRSGDI